jgi:hypothetical protein
MLFKTTAEVKKYINIDVNMKFDKLRPSIEEAELRFIVPLLGDAFYTAFLTDYAAASTIPDDLTADNQALLPYIQRALAFYTAYMMVDEIGVQVGDLGVQQQFNANSQPAPAYKVNRLTMKYITSADVAADDLLEYLEEEASPSKYGEWYSDPVANTAMTGTIVYKTSIASRFIDINHSRRVFLRLKKRIKDIESTYVKRLICKDQYSEIISQLQTGTVTLINERLIEKLQPIISKKALFLTLPSIAISIEAEGLTIYSSNDTVVQKQIATAAEKQQLMLSLKDGDFGYEADEAELDAFLKENIADYPLIEDSPCWTSRSEDGTVKYKVDNDSCNKHFSV